MKGSDGLLPVGVPTVVPAKQKIYTAAIQRFKIRVRLCIRLFFSSEESYHRMVYLHVSMKHWCTNWLDGVKYSGKTNEDEKNVLLFASVFLHTLYKYNYI